MGKITGIGEKVSLVYGSVVEVSPMVDVDTSFTYNGDKTVATMVQTYGTQTKTTVYTYVLGYLQSIATVIT